MIDTNAAAIHPAPLGAGEMAQVLAAVFAREEDVAALVAHLAGGSAQPILLELRLFTDGWITPEHVSPTLRWLLPEIHAELGTEFRALRA
jgi:hypothetical protein